MMIKIIFHSFFRRCFIALFIKFMFVFLVAQSAYAGSRCKERNYIFLPDTISCSYNVTRIDSSPVTSRDVYWEVPLGTPPTDGWPVAIIYQGTAEPVEFVRTSLSLFGTYYEAKTIKKLLDSGYAVLAPRAAAGVAWYTNTSGILYELTTDYTFLNNLFDAIDLGVFGHLDGGRKYATGISSGGYNTSRMALTWPGEFKALVVHSASWATCGGALCVMPINMPEDHPPTKFIHGLFDPIAPWWAMDLYYDRLLYEGIETERLTVSDGHSWFSSSPNAVVNWFNGHP